LPQRQQGWLAFHPKTLGLGGIVFTQWKNRTKWWQMGPRPQ